MLVGVGENEQLTNCEGSMQEMAGRKIKKKNNNSIKIQNLLIELF